MSVLLFEDLLIVPLLAIVAFLSPVKIASDTPLWLDIAKAIGSVTAIVAAGRWLLNPLFRILARSKAREVMTAAALLVVLGAAVLMEKGGLSMAMGAFLAGVMLSESDFRHQLEADVEPFRGLLLGLFFLAVGMSLDLDVVAQNWKLVLSGVLALMAAKVACIYAVARLAKSSHDEALERAVLMAHGGEFAFVLFAAANAQGVISDTNNANMTAIVVLSMVLTPLLLILHGRLPKKATAERGDDAIEKAAVLVVAIDNKEQALQIVRFAREANPNIKIVARAYDRRHTFDLYQADADEIVRETFDSGIRAGKRVLEALGLPREKAEKVGGIFFRMDRRGMHKMAVLYNPAIAGYTNRALMEEAQRQDDRVREAVQAFLRGEEDVDESV